MRRRSPGPGSPENSPLVPVTPTTTTRVPVTPASAIPHTPATRVGNAPASHIRNTPAAGVGVTETTGVRHTIATRVRNATAARVRYTPTARVQNARAIAWHAVAGAHGAGQKRVSTRHGVTDALPGVLDAAGCRRRSGEVHEADRHTAAGG